jgi:hypothetical protein
MWYELGLYVILSFTFTDGVTYVEILPISSFTVFQTALTLLSDYMFILIRMVGLFNDLS